MDNIKDFLILTVDKHEYQKMLIKAEDMITELWLEGTRLIIKVAYQSIQIIPAEGMLVEMGWDTPSSNIKLSSGEYAVSLKGHFPSDGDLATRLAD